MLGRNKFSEWLNKRSPAQLIMIFYIIAVTVSCMLLGMPIAHKDGINLTFMEVLFTSVSAVSVTGLSVVSIVDTFNSFGVILLAIVLQFGGVGVMTLGTLIWIVVGKKIGLKERRLIMADHNQYSFKGIVKLMKGIFKLILWIELIGFLVLGTYYLTYFPNWQEAYFHGFFASISATTNGGFDITGQSLIPFKDDYFVQTIHIALIIFGSIGFPVLIEVKDYLFSSQEERKFMRFSLFTKVTTFTYACLLIFGFLIIILLEWNHFFADKSWHEMIFYSLFQSTTSRSGGLSTLDMNVLTEQSQFVTSALMFVGASPSSVGGGIRTTTFALVIIFIITFARGKRTVAFFRREVHEEDLYKAVVVILMAVLLCFTAVTILTVLEDSSLMAIIFEVSSAFGTTGLSMGITEELSPVSKVILMILMFIGRIGILTLLFSFNNERKKSEFHYPKEKIIIG
ncbi:potassium uptake protein, TrkH family [Salinibacillus kushneri]|uniref:Potassium uptake protein, TrkH family n=1 Tax=Salinibacillus kushneri TaxID=237682 RepID=A0A1I0I8H2_9BACI|nr:TrkH family potassium uptake protein [Salinibacillus kushneri]SET93030.1 potassium uptake protein, TrkH family [Salinibacillus kushneri]